MFVLCTSTGGLAALLVYVGDAFRWPHFNRRAGYFGTDFISSVLHAIGDPYAIHIVAVLCFAMRLASSSSSCFCSEGCAENVEPGLRVATFPR
jgi:hypothetical protein